MTQGEEMLSLGFLNPHNRAHGLHTRSCRDGHRADGSSPIRGCEVPEGVSVSGAAF
jgi:hypothetical protein